ncbi:LPD23 domain-containing protein [Campylobacter sp.]|uniref:LPD23 domain-containing protein n=1 Tax=Campylobacter sp. TaxID=205 RepID=UPI002A816BE6|nr:LPD23 domain-containing protein [Campylobacter sp.]MDY4446234.1 LPD23 domain-containing protein [Campylobacter sp.]
MKIKDILSNDEIFELQKNQGKSTDEILQIARDRYKEQLASGEIARKEQAKLEYQKRNDLNAIKELNALKKEAIDKGASGAEIEQLQNNYNIMRYGTPEQKKQLEQAQNAVKIKQEIIDEAARNDEKYGGFSGGASRNLQKAWGNTLVGIGEAAKYLGIDSQRLNRGADYYKNAVEYLNNIDKSRQKQGLKTFSEHAGNFVGATLGPGEVATLPFGFGKTALRTAGKFAGIELLGGTPRRIGESVTEPNSNLGFLEKSALESGLAGVFGGLLHGGYNLYKGLKGTKGAGRAETAPNTAPNGGVSGTTTPQNSNADDLATNGSWLDYGSTPPPNGGLVRGDNFVTDPNSANVEQNIVANFELSPNVRDLTKISTDEISADLSHLSEKHPEMFEKASDVFKLIKEIKDEPQFFYRNNRLDGALIAKRLQEQGKIGKVVVNKENGEVIHATKAREQDLARLERVANKNDERVRALSAVSSRKVEQGGGLPSETIPQHPLNTADDIIDLVPDENGVYGVAYNGSSKELAKIATEIAKGEIQSLGAKRLVYIADNIAEAAAKDAEQKISANIAKIDDDSVELYANNTALLGDIAKKYPMLNKDEQIELANKQILANASAELLEYSKFLNGGSLPNDARLLGKNAGRMILKSLNAGASKQEIIDMLLKAGISGRNSTAAKALIQTGDINAYNAQMRQGEAELIAELSQNVRVATKNESIGAILGSAKEKAIKNDELLKKGVGNQGLDDVINTFKSSKNGKEFEVAENGFGRELLSYDGQVANEEMKRAFLAWEAQEKKADITLHDGRKVVFLEPDEAVQLSYGNSYLYGEKDLEALFARRNAESLEQKLKRLQSHPAYENLLKMRENTKASELKGDTVGGSKPTVFYEPQSERYLRTQGGGGLPNAERSITITKADVAKLRADKANEALATKLENNLEALTGDPAASGLIDDLLTRDYHLASAAKKSELVAPKNADEVAGNSRIPSNKNAGMKAGFSTQALNELMLGLGGGGANAMSEDDPNKKAQAFIKGFLAGFGGAKAAKAISSLLAKNAPKLAPQLARASEKMASDFPRLLNDRPDILGGVLGRMNNAKDKFSFIFGGEKALGANKAKLKTARDMAKNGVKDDEIWAKTGWYKDIDGKWKFEINAEGGKLKELNAPELDEATKIIKRDYFDKQMNLKELEDFIQFKNGYIDFDEIKRFYDLPKDMSKGELTQKFPYFKMSVNDYMEHGFYKDIDLLHDEIMPARKILNQEYSKTPLNEVLDDRSYKPIKSYKKI